MLLKNDNPLTSIDRRYLGPEEGGWIRTVISGAELTFTGWIAAAILDVVLLVVGEKAGLHLSIGWLVASAAGAVFLAKLLIRFVDHERPLTAVIATFWREVGCPRAPTTAVYRWKEPKIRRLTETRL